MVRFLAAFILAFIAGLVALLFLHLAYLTLL